MSALAHKKLAVLMAVVFGITAGISHAGTSASPDFKIVIPKDINTSFIGININPAITPQPKNPVYSPVELRSNPIPYQSLSGGLTFSPPKVYGKKMIIKALYYGKPFIEFIAIKDGGDKGFSLDEISSHLSGRLIEPDLTYSIDNIRKNIEEECRGLYTTNFSINDMNMTYFGCSSQSADFYVSVLDDSMTVNQTYGYEPEPKISKSGEDNRKILIINFLANDLVNYKNPSKSLSKLVIPEATLNLFFSKAFSKRSLNGKIEDITESIASDISFLQSRADDNIRIALFNKNLLITSKNQGFHPIKITSDNNQLKLKLYNITENYYGNNLVTISDETGEHISATTLITPELMGTKNITELVEKISKDKSCMAEDYEGDEPDNTDVKDDINSNEDIAYETESPKGNQNSFLIKCDVSFGSNEQQKSYYLVDIQNLISGNNYKNLQDNKRSIMMSLILGEPSDAFRESVLSTNMLMNNLKWNLSMRDISEMDMSYITEIPLIRSWLNQKDEEKDVTLWENFVTESEKEINATPDASPEKIMEILKKHSYLLYPNRK